MINPMSLENQVIIVTGAGQGIGRGVALNRSAAMPAPLSGTWLTRTFPRNW